MKIKIKMPKFKGIKWNPVRDIGKGLNQVNANLASLESGVRRDVSALGMNVERNVQRQLNSLLALTQPGGLNNLGQTLLNTSISPMGVLANPNDLQRVTGEINIDRMAKEAQAKAVAQEAADAQALIDAQNQQVSTFLGQMTEQRRRQPGRSQTILGTGSSNPNTILSMLR